MVDYENLNPGEHRIVTETATTEEALEALFEQMRSSGGWPEAAAREAVDLARHASTEGLTRMVDLADNSETLMVSMQAVLIAAQIMTMRCEGVIENSRVLMKMVRDGTPVEEINAFMDGEIAKSVLRA